jgi:dipeptidyl aminopeptidase/acylaminoacyl peptidase
MQVVRHFKRQLWKEVRGSWVDHPGSSRSDTSRIPRSFYLDRVNTPLFIVHGAQDSAVASFLGDELFVGLRRLGKTVLYAKYQGEDHVPAIWSYGNQLHFSGRMIAWFSKYGSAREFDETANWRRLERFAFLGFQRRTGTRRQ